MLKEARNKPAIKNFGYDVRRSLRNLTKSWLNFGGEMTQDEIVSDSNVDNAHTYSFLQKSGEMNHMGRYECDHCEGEMRIVSYPVFKTPPPGIPDMKVPIGQDVRWQCTRCGRKDETSFRVCSKCGKKTVPDQWAASARELPISLNAGGCTDCERCLLCEGILAIGNLMWFYGRWTHSYPSPEYDSRTGEEIMVTRERSKGYGFHTHRSCHDKNPQAIVQHILQRTPEWYKQGEAEQQRTEALRLLREGRCLRCKNPLSFWDRILEREEHTQCAKR